MNVVRVAVFAACLVLGGCESTEGLAGVWSGTARVSTGISTSTFFSLTLTETPQGVVSGAGRITTTTPTGQTNFPATVAGAHAHPAVSLAITASGATPANFSGAFDATLSRIHGVLYGSGFFGDSLHLVRNTPGVTARLVEP